MYTIPAGSVLTCEFVSVRVSFGAPLGEVAEEEALREREAGERVGLRDTLLYNLMHIKHITNKTDYPLTERIIYSSIQSYPILPPPIYLHIYVCIDRGPLLGRPSRRVALLRVCSRRSLEMQS
jgi:hypothetical protein